METERLILCRIGTEHAEALLRLRTEEQVMKYIERPRPPGMDELMAFIEKVNTQVDNNENISWAVVLKETNEFTGIIGFYRPLPEHARGEIGYSMLPEFWGKGIMSEAMKAVLEYGFETIGFNSIFADLNANNTRSEKIVIRNGFRKEAHFRENFYWEGTFRDSLIYTMLKSEWRFMSVHGRS